MHGFGSCLKVKHNHVEIIVGVDGASELVSLEHPLRIARVLTACVASHRFGNYTFEQLA